MESQPESRHPMSPIRRFGLFFVFLWFFIGGIAHFAATELEMRIVPPSLPSPHALVIISGMLELLGAAGILFNSARYWAGVGLILLTVAVTSAP